MFHPTQDTYLRKTWSSFFKKFGFTEDEFKRIMALPARTFQEFPNNQPYLELTRRLRVGTRLRQLRKQLKPGQPG